MIKTCPHQPLLNFVTSRINHNQKQILFDITIKLYTWYLVWHTLHVSYLCDFASNMNFKNQCSFTKIMMDYYVSSFQSNIGVNYFRSEDCWAEVAANNPRAHYQLYWLIAGKQIGPMLPITTLIRITSFICTCWADMAAIYPYVHYPLYWPTAC